MTKFNKITRITWVTYKSRIRVRIADLFFLCVYVSLFLSEVARIVTSYNHYLNHVSVAIKNYWSIVLALHAAPILDDSNDSTYSDG